MLASRQWLIALAEEYGTSLGVHSPEANSRAMEDVLELLRLAPWHFRLLFNGVEAVASLWCVLYRLTRAGRTDHRQETEAFAKLPLISAPLLRVYRSLLALSWFEQPEILPALGVTKALEQRQKDFRAKRDAA